MCEGVIISVSEINFLQKALPKWCIMVLDKIRWHNWISCMG